MVRHIVGRSSAADAPSASAADSSSTAAPVTGAAHEAPPLAAYALSKRYGSRWALRDVDLAIEPGQITALVGPNGAGKSTLMKTWVGFEQPSRGAARVFGIDPFRRRADALDHVGYVPQADVLYGDFSAIDHLMLARRYRERFDERAASERLDRLRIPSRVPVRTLSAGQRAQVVLTIAVSTGADILLLDEPFASLDPLARREALHLLAEVVREHGRTAILSSHVVADIQQACDRVLVLSEGGVRLHADVAAALRDHVVVTNPSNADEAAVGTFLEATGEPITLVRSPAPNGWSARPASLDHIVLGYLAAGRKAAHE